MQTGDSLPETYPIDQSSAVIGSTPEQQSTDSAEASDANSESLTDEAGLDHDSQFEGEVDDDSLPELPITAFSPINFSITNRRIGDIFASYNEGELDTRPAFQRGYVWDRIKASRLIESVLLHVPLPLGPVDKPVLAPARSERLRRRHTHVATGVTS
jgi:hypothetical protein